MKTTVGSTKEKGRVSAQLLTISGEVMMGITSPTGEIAGAAMDAHSAYVLGNALVRMAESLEAADNARTNAAQIYKASLVATALLQGAAA